jgi:peptidoglycan/LPS O-acetylase OafA/YrhL
VGVGAFLAARIARFGWSLGTAAGDWLPLAIWLLLLALLLAVAGGAPGPAARAAVRALEWTPLARLGAVSYATYLVHWPVLSVCQALFRRALGDPAPAVLFVLHVALSLPLVALASFALHRAVERPGIALGRRLAARA